MNISELTEHTKELIAEKIYSELRDIMCAMSPQDISQLFEEIPRESLILLFRILPKELAAETFVEMDGDLQKHLISAFSDAELKEVFDELFVDDTVDIIEEMPANVVYRILKNSDPETRCGINTILKYPSDSAGSIMTIEFVSLKQGMTVSDAFEKIRRVGTDKETIYTCYVTDSFRHLLGIVTVKDLLLADAGEDIEKIMDSNIISAHTHDDREDVASKLRKYDLLALPVVDDETRLVGIVTIDDAVDVLSEEAEEDFAKMAAMEPIENSYFKTSVFSHFKKRILWLLIMMLSATITGTIITRYENAFATIPLLVAFIPMLMDTGGNCGSQSSTMIIRGMATDEIHGRDFWRVMFKELRIGLLVGIVLASVTAVRVLIMYNGFAQKLTLIIVLALTLCIVTTAAKLLGCMLPMLARKLKLDPAIMAAPIITTIVDTVSVLAYFNIAILFIKI